MTPKEIIKEERDRELRIIKEEERITHSRKARETEEKVNDY